MDFQGVGCQIFSPCNCPWVEHSAPDPPKIAQNIFFVISMDSRGRTQCTHSKYLRFWGRVEATRGGCKFRAKKKLQNRCVSVCVCVNRKTQKKIIKKFYQNGATYDAGDIAAASTHIVEHKLRGANQRIVEFRIYAVGQRPAIGMLPYRGGTVCWRVSDRLIGNDLRAAH